MRLGIERERHRKAERDHRDKDRQNPFRRVIGGHYCRAYLDGQPSNDCVAQRDAINLPLFQLTEQRVHLGSRRLHSIGYSGHHVESGSARLFRSLGEIRICLIAPALNALDQVMAADSQKFIGGKIVRSEAPLNLETPFESLEGFLTPTESFYVRTHFPIPAIDRDDWWLRLEGEVEKPFAINYEQLLELKSVTIPVTLECAGNNRSFLEPRVKGVQWGLGAVGTAEWTGVPLSILLDRAGVKANACEVILEGADGGMLEDPKSPPGELKFARSIPLEKARADILLVYKMNGSDLPPEHGFPVRAIVPGWYAMASIKWLQRIILTDEPFTGYYQTIDYAYWKRRADVAELTPLTEMQIKAEIANPAEDETVAPNSSVRVHGAAWTSDGEIAKVELSTDGGSTWNETNLLGEPKPNAWRLWEFNWQTPTAPGKQTLIARATDSLGRTQPLHRDTDRGTYMINHLLPITVEVKLNCVAASR
jgi:DMSO/TMAO reductase YedYZ molybdopterin-dependent catalytic subunit